LLFLLYNKAMKIFIGSDHAGYDLKEKIAKTLTELGYAVVDMGAHNLDDSDDYPDFIALVAEAIMEGSDDVRGIILGGSGQGEAILANRYPHVRAAVYYGGSTDIVRLSREHNDANVLSLGARFISEEDAFEAIKLWLRMPFSEDERHVRRLEKIKKITKKLKKDA